MFNVENYIEDTINSLLSQTYKDIEIILVDDASTDRTVANCKKFDDARIRIIELVKNQGQVNAYLSGLEFARGEYIAFVDSDDWVSPHIYELMMKQMNLTDADIVACGCFHVYEKEKIIEPFNISELNGFELNHNEIVQLSYDLHSLNNPLDSIIKLYRWNKLYKKEIVKGNLKYCQSEIRVFEDNNLVIPCLLDCKKISYVNQPLYFYRRRKTSTMTMFDKNILMANRIFLRNQELIFHEKGINHRMATDAYVTSMYSLQRIFQSRLNLKEEFKCLETIREDIVRYNVTISIAKKCGASKKVLLILICLRIRLLFCVSFFGRMNHILDIIRGRLI